MLSRPPSSVPLLTLHPACSAAKVDSLLGMDKLDLLLLLLVLWLTALQMPINYEHADVIVVANQRKHAGGAAPEGWRMQAAKGCNTAATPRCKAVSGVCLLEVCTIGLT
jgi:hypothetical protein